MTITELEFVLFLGFVCMTFMYFKIRAELNLHRRVTAEVFMRIAQGKMKVKETEEGFDLVAGGE